jgi:hypothetical protein
MDCKSLQAILAGERADDLSTTESEAFDRHLEACAPCRDSLARAEDELEALADRMEPPSIAPAAWDKVTRAVKAEATRPILTVHAGGGAARAFAIAAALLLAVGIGFLLPLDLIRGDGKGQFSAVGTDAVNVNPPPLTPTESSTPPSLPATSVVCETLEVEPPFEAEKMYLDCGDEQMLVIFVRDKSL